MFYIKLILLSLIFTYSYGGVKGSYEISLTNHPLFHNVKIDLDESANILNYKLVGDLAERSRVTASFKQISDYEKQTGFLSIDLEWLNDGSREKTKIEIFVSNDSHFGNTLVSVVTVYSDGSTSVELDKKATLKYLDSEY
ncbi:MAG: hypothetical protein VX341_12285 [Bdellovibrionota bacterium]|nr:hypothetical protein [Bdellovibrionota bacterium]